jgi:hypothetical protein
MKRKWLSLFLSTIFVTGSVLFPYSVSFGLGNPVLKLYMVGNSDSTSLLDKVEKARGEKIKGFDQFTLNVDTKWPELNNNADAFALPINKVNDANKEDIVNFIKSGKLVYLYGDSVNIKDAEKLFGVKLTPSEEAIKSKTKKPNAMKEIQDFNVIGLKVTNLKQISLGSIKVVDNGSLDEIKYADVIMDNINNKHISKNHLLKENVAKAESVFVDSETNHVCEMWSGSTKIASINGDYYLYKDNSEQNQDYDYFTMKSYIELTKYNGAYNERLNIHHDVPWSSDQIEDWSPGSSSGTEFSVSIPWGLNWTWSTGDSVAVTTTGNQTYDWSNWDVDNRWWQAHLVSPCRFKPGTAWLSTGTYAGLDILSEGTILYNGNYHTIEQLNNYRYDY